MFPKKDRPNWKSLILGIENRTTTHVKQYKVTFILVHLLLLKYILNNLQTFYINYFKFMSDRFDPNLKSQVL